ncbi:MAG: hypothetical protein DDT42_02126 [candidate division WS2 bacterium]|uniref:Uncharacterized protein n=1 Tax=Psychracetigena formicireducens TaxID=2986056 RepID=A0A9E2BNI7_PSYF1|nr:hypothetical protein [Candidatus Psychracetigena formicireducens]
MFLPARPDTNVMENIPTAKYSKEENLMAIRAMDGERKIRHRKLNSPPKKEYITPTFKALVASPFFAIG